jgi:hypothetical protein
MRIKKYFISLPKWNCNTFPYFHEIHEDKFRNTLKSASHGLQIVSYNMPMTNNIFTNRIRGFPLHDGRRWTRCKKIIFGFLCCLVAGPPPSTPHHFAFFGSLSSIRARHEIVQVEFCPLALSALCDRRKSSPPPPVRGDFYIVLI